MCKLLTRLLIIIFIWYPFHAYSDESRPSAKIIGGITTTENEIPWQAYLNITFPDGSGGESTFVCGGVVISPDAVLTAAHCVRNGSDTVAPEKLRVWAGSISLFSFNSLNAVPVSDIVVHPSYNSSRFANDIAIIKLATSLPGAASPIRMADRNTQLRVDNAFANGWVDNGPREPNLLVSGWGSTELTSLFDSGSILLQQTLLSGVPDSTCDELWGANINSGDFPIFICAGSIAPEIGRDSCFGDSGGPLVWQDPQAAADSDFGLRLVGLVSFGESCAGALPGVYTEVANYQGWIESELGSAVRSQPTPVLTKNPFSRDYAGAGVEVDVAASPSSDSSGSGSRSGGAIVGWLVWIGLLVAACRRWLPLRLKL